LGVTVAVSNRVRSRTAQGKTPATARPRNRLDCVDRDPWVRVPSERGARSRRTRSRSPPRGSTSRGSIRRIDRLDL